MDSLWHDKNIQSVLTKIEATKSIIFGVEENTRRVDPIILLSFKHKANILYWTDAKKNKRALNVEWFCRKVYFFVFDNYLHNLCINLMFKTKISWIDQVTVVFSSPGYIFWLSPKALNTQCFSRIILRLTITEA